MPWRPLGSGAAGAADCTDDEFCAVLLAADVMFVSVGHGTGSDEPGAELFDGAGAEAPEAVEATMPGV